MLLVLGRTDASALSLPDLGHLDFYADHHHEPVNPALAVDHVTGRPGSYFSVTGTNYAPYNCYRVLVNGHLVSDTPVCADGEGALAFELRTPSSDEARYVVEVSVEGQPGATTSFETSAAAPAAWPSQGIGQSFEIPAGIGLDIFIYLPMTMR
jgi:hypothetical protein